MEFRNSRAGYSAKYPLFTILKEKFGVKGKLYQNLTLPSQKAKLATIQILLQLLLESLASTSNSGLYSSQGNTSYFGYFFIG